jgi:hypothetical protein
MLQLELRSRMCIHGMPSYRVQVVPRARCGCYPLVRLIGSDVHWHGMKTRVFDASVLDTTRRLVSDLGAEQEPENPS